MNQTTAAEEILEPDLPIIDPHHHLWDATPLIPGAETYLLTEFLRDAGTGHRIEATVYVEAQAMYRADGPERLRPVGEVEFANGIAAMSASGIYGPARICAGIVGYADLRLGDEVTEVLEALCAASNGRLRGVRNLSATDPDSTIYPHPRPPGLLRDSRFRAAARLAQLRLSFDAWLHHTQLDEW
jgi:predicted TIM-barrel fold metal-dependent hydrolase